MNHRPSKRDLIDRGEKDREREGSREGFKGDKITAPFEINRIGRSFTEKAGEKDPSRNKFPVISSKKNARKKNGIRKEHGKDTKRGTEN